MATLVTGAAALVAASGAGAFGFGPFSPAASLGQPLDLQVPILLGPGETLEPDCVRAEVLAGENRLPDALVRARVEGQGSAQSVRVQTLAPIEELVVQVTVSAGCATPFTRTFTAFPDPPYASPAVQSAPASAPAAAPQAAPASRAPASRTAAPRPRPRPASSGADRPAASGDAASRGAGTRASLSSPPTRAAAATSRASLDRLTLEPLAPRLKLDLAEPMFTPEALAAAASAAGAASAQLASEQQRLEELQATLAMLKRQSASQRAAANEIKAQLREAQARAGWMPWLLGLAALLFLALGVALWRLRKQPQSRPEWWRSSLDGASAAPSSQYPPQAIEAERDGPAAVGDEPPAATVRPEPAVAAAVPPSFENSKPAVEQWATENPISLSALADPRQREMAVEELLDLEQQTEFFIALGQEDAAIEQLMEHLRGTGGASPVPYLQLLDIYRRRGERAMYDTLRTRFNKQFNAYVPDWATGPAHGRWLEGYPEVVERLQQVWPHPEVVMEELESLLFRRDPMAEMFDLPAYRDVLMLYAIARDLPREPAPSDVDVLLPLGTESAADAVPALETQPAPLSLAPTDLETRPADDPGTTRPAG